MPAKTPVSPHLQIYRLPLAAILSVSHRISGAILAGMAVLLCFLLAAAAYVPELWEFAVMLLRHPLGQVVLILATFALAFHFCTGIRHLIWDTGTGLSMSAVQRSNWFVLIGAIALTALAWGWI